MEFLFSNYPPMRTSCKTFSDVFYGLIPQTSQLDIAVGYVSSDALIELQKTIELNNNIRTLNLIVGMHYFCLLDQPLCGRPSDGENMNLGILDSTSRPIPEVTEAIREIAEKAVPYRMNR